MVKKYRLTDEEYKSLIDLIEEHRKIPYIVVGGHPPTSLQEVVNGWWIRLGQKNGFNGTTARPDPEGIDDKDFLADANETA